MKKLLTFCYLSIVLIFLPGCSGSSSQAANSGPQSVPMTHILICCRSSNEGVIKFKVGDEWIANHDYRNKKHARALLSTIQKAGINDVIIDLTNPSQWATEPASWPGCVPNENALWDQDTKYQLETIEEVCGELGMRFIMYIGNPAAHTMKYWNDIAEKIWNEWAQKDIYRKYGYGDNRPMLVVFYPGEDFWPMFENTPQNEKNYLEKFRIGTCQVNSPINEKESDGWGYRHMSSASNDAVRFVAPNQGVPPTEWKRSTLEQWKEKVEWAGQATEYTIFGSYDDTCDAIFWGIAETSESKNEYKRYPGGEKPDDYYNVVKDYLTKRKKGK